MESGEKQNEQQRSVKRQYRNETPKVADATLEDLRTTVWAYYRENARPMPWRKDTNPYWVLVSEFMLQQTQVSRVAGHFSQFVDQFPDLQTLAAARRSAVIAAWQGLGYNRRAVYLHETAKIVCSRWNGVLTGRPEKLVVLPGIGPNTAGSIAAFAFNSPVVFIETNIRRVFLHLLFPEEEAVADTVLLPYIEKTLDRRNPREWYWALMDYGAHLKTRVSNPNRRSRHYAKQAPFERSIRQARGEIVRLLIEHGTCVEEEIPAYTGFPVEHVQTAVGGLVRDGVLRRNSEGAVALAD